MADKGLLILAAIAALAMARRGETSSGSDPGAIGGNITPPGVEIPSAVVPGAISFSVIGQRKEINPGGTYWVKSAFRNRTTEAGAWVAWPFRVRYSWSGPGSREVSVRVTVPPNGVAQLPLSALPAPSAPGVYDLIGTLFAAVPTPAGSPSAVFVKTSVEDVKKGFIRVVTSQGAAPPGTMAPIAPVRITSPITSLLPALPAVKGEPKIIYPTVVPGAHAVGPGPGGRFIPTVVPDPSPRLGAPLWLPQGMPSVAPPESVAAKRIAAGPGSLF